MGLGLPKITRNFGNYRYGNYIGNLIGKVITLKK